MANNTAKRFLNGAEKFHEWGHLEAKKKAWMRSAIASYKDNSEAIWTALEAKKQEAGIDGKDHRGYVYLARNNLDKRRSIAGGEATGEAHRNLPACASCAIALADAFACAERHFTGCNLNAQCDA